MLPYPMRQARRALIRRALAGPVAAEPHPPVRTPRPTADRIAAITTRHAVTADTFRHLNTPEASERLRSWQKTLPSARR